MRIIAGDYKGRKLITPNGADLVRPTAEKVKGAIFSMLQDRIDGVKGFDGYREALEYFSGK